jgi:multidrug efflux system membrane fusion protein
LKATFDNGKNTLWPGQFVDVVLTLTRQPNSIVVPSAGINVGQNGQYTFVVGSDNTVSLRNVTVQRTFGDQSIIASGLKAGETIVTDGQLRLTNGSHIEVKGKYTPPQPIPGISGSDLPATPNVPNTSLPAPNTPAASAGSTR